MKNRPLLKASLASLAIIPFLILINSYSPPPSKAPEGYNSTIIAFEMASDEQELEAVLSPLTTDEVKGLDKLNYVDFGFMLLYGFFIWLFMTLLAKEQSSSLLFSSRWLAAVVVIADILENIQLLKLSSFLDGGMSGVSSSLSLLAVFTWIKWLLLAVSFVIIGYTLFKLKPISKIIGVVLCIPFVLGIVAVITKVPQYEDTFATSIFGCFFILTLYGFFYKNLDSTTV